MYKLLNDGTTIKRLSDGAFIPVDEGNLDYQQFKYDVVGIGTTCVEGIDVGITTAYDVARAAEYPSLEEQQDMQYWDAVNGTCLLYTSPSPRDATLSRMPSSA